MPPAPDLRVIAYAGEPGAFAEDAVLAAFGDVRGSRWRSFRAVFEAVAGGDAAAGMIPIENVIHGTVRENYDLLLEFDLIIHGEVVVPVDLCPGGPARAAARGHRAGLLAHPGARPGGGLPARPTVAALSTYNTAGAGKAIADRGERGAAAVLSPRAAALFGLEVLADGIGDLPDNRTRFLVLARPGDTAAALRRPADPSAHDDRRRRAQRARHAAGRPPRPRRPRAQHAQVGVATAAASVPGSTSSGSTSTATPRIRRWRAALAALDRASRR